MRENLFDNLDKEQTFNELLVETAATQKGSLVTAIIQNAKEGDASALKILQNAFQEMKFTQEDSVKITPAQYKQVIKLAAERITE